MNDKTNNPGAAGVNDKTNNPASSGASPSTDKPNPAVGGASPGEVVGGGTLVRAPKTCECKTPDIAKNKIEVNDEWTCGTCKQLWRAKAAKVKEGEQGYGIWKRVTKRTRKSKTKPDAEETKP